jgi:hypothetical protein
VIECPLSACGQGGHQNKDSRLQTRQRPHAEIHPQLVLIKPWNTPRDEEQHLSVGWYEIPFNRHFYVFEPPRELAEIDADLKKVTDRILTMIGGLSA